MQWVGGRRDGRTPGIAGKAGGRHRWPVLLLLAALPFLTGMTAWPGDDGQPQTVLPVNTPAAPPDPPPASAEPGSAATPLPAVVPAPAPPTKPDLGALRAALTALRCSVLELEGPEDGPLLLSGVVEDEDSRERIRTMLDRHAPGQALRTELALTAPALCAPLAMVETARLGNLEGPTPLAIHAGPAGRRLKGGDNLRFDIATSDSPAHLQVDYYSVNGTVVHLLPNPLETSGRVEAHSRRRLGDKEANGRFWSIAPPFGQELIVVIASTSPLFTAPRPEAEPIGNYLPELKRAMNAAAEGGEPVVAAARLVLTEPP